MGSFVQVNSISIDLADSIGDKASAGRCQHFSIRGYVSEIRKKDWKKCWPFPVNESEESPSLPPLDVPKYRCFGCDSCHQGKSTDIDKDDQTDFHCCSSGCKSDTNSGKAIVKSGVQQDPIPNISERVEIDLNANLNCLNDCLPITNEREKQPGFSLSRMIDLEIGLDDNPDQLGLVQDLHTAKRGFECEEVSDVDLTVNNIKCMEKSSAKICNGGPSSVDNQCQKELQGACTEGTSIMEADNHTAGDHIELADSDHTVPASPENIVENDFQDHDHHLEKSTGLSRRRPRKVRLMSDLLSENGQLKTVQTATQGSPSHGIFNASAASEPHLIFPGKVDMQGLTNNMGPKKRKLPLDEVRRAADICDQRGDTKVQNLEGDAQTTNNAVLDGGSNSKGVLQGIGLQDATKAYYKHETERSHIMGKKKHRRIQVTDNHLIPEQQQGHHREDDDPVDAYKAYASKTVSSRLSPRAFTGKGMDNFPFHDVLRFENEFNFSKGKGKMPQTAAELDPLFCRKTDMLLEDSYPYSGGKLIPNIPGDIPVPLHHGRQTSQGLEKGVNLSLNNYLATQIYSTKCIHQIENRLPLSLTLQEGTSKIHQLKRKDSETNAFGGPSIPSKHITDSISAGKGAHLEETAGARIKEKPVEGVENLGSVKRYSEKTTESSEPGTPDDILMEIVELMAKNQYERCLADVENRSSKLEKSTVRRKAQMTSGSTKHDEMGVRLLKESQKDKPHGRPKKHNTVERENLKSCKRKPVHYSSPFDGNNLCMNNLCPPQLPFEFEISRSQKKPLSGFQFSPMGSSSQLGSSTRKFNLSLEERGSSNATLEVQGGCSLHKTILQQDGEASRIWASLSPNHISLGYDVPKKVVSHPSSSNMDMTSLRSGSVHKQNMKRDVDLNYINLNASGIEKLNRNTSPGTFSRINGEYSYPCKHNGMDHHQNLRGSLDLYSNETIPAMHLLSLMDAGMQSRTPFNVSGVSGEVLKRSPCPGDCNTVLEIGTSKAHSTQKRQSSDYFRKSYLSDKPHGCFLGSPTFGASSSTQLDTKMLKATGFSSQNSTKSGRKEKIKSATPPVQNQFAKPFSWPRIETETPLQRKMDVHGSQETAVPLKIISGISCMVNRNPADFTMPTGNVYMIRGEDLKFEKSVPKNKPHIPSSHGFKQQRNSKGTKMKEHSNH